MDTYARDHLVAGYCVRMRREVVLACSGLSNCLKLASSNIFHLLEPVKSLQAEERSRALETRTPLNSQSLTFSTLSAATRRRKPREIEAAAVFASGW